MVNSVDFATIFILYYKKEEKSITYPPLCSPLDRSVKFIKTLFDYELD